MKIGTRVKMVSYNGGKTPTPRHFPEADYSRLIGESGTIVGGKEDAYTRGRILVQFDDDIVGMGLQCCTEHDKRPGNSLWILKTDLEESQEGKITLSYEEVNTILCMLMNVKGYPGERVREARGRMRTWGKGLEKKLQKATVTIEFSNDEAQAILLGFAAMRAQFPKEDKGAQSELGCIMGSHKIPLMGKVEATIFKSLGGKQ